MEAIIYEYMDEKTGQLTEVTNLFPTDSLTKRLAFKEKVNKIRVLKLKNYSCCYDKWTAITIFIGIPVFTCLGIVCLGIISLGF